MQCCVSEVSLIGFQIDHHCQIDIDMNFYGAKWRHSLFSFQFKHWTDHELGSWIQLRITLLKIEGVSACVRVPPSAKWRLNSIKANRCIFGEEMGGVGDGSLTQDLHHLFAPNIDCFHIRLYHSIFNPPSLPNCHYPSWQNIKRPFNIKETIPSSRRNNKQQKNNNIKNVRLLVNRYLSRWWTKFKMVDLWTVRLDTHTHQYNQLCPMIQVNG